MPCHLAFSGATARMNSAAEAVAIPNGKAQGLSRHSDIRSRDFEDDTLHKLFAVAPPAHVGLPAMEGGDATGDLPRLKDAGSSTSWASITACLHDQRVGWRKWLRS
jgi:hypothetical protein